MTRNVPANINMKQSRYIKVSSFLGFANRRIVVETSATECVFESTSRLILTVDAKNICRATQLLSGVDVRIHANYTEGH